MWFDIVGVTLGFIGSVIFSAGLIKPKDQIRAENETYWDANPYTTSEALKSQPYYIVAFVLIISGFATSLGGMLGKEFKDSDVLVSILFSVSISLLGCLATALFFIRKISSYQKKKTQVAKRVFINAIRTYGNEMRGMENKTNAADLFEAHKPTYQKDLLEKAQAIPEPDNEPELLTVREIDPTTSPKQFAEAADRYLANNKPPKSS